MVHILGISGSPRVAATNALVKAALEGVASIPGCETELIDLGELDIRPCRDHCIECVAQSACVQDDDMQDIYPRMLAADGFLVGTPVYYGGPSALCKAFMERMQGFGIEEKKLRLKVGGAIAVGSGRSAGVETTLIALNLWYHINEILPVGLTAPAAGWGVSGLGGTDPDIIEQDILDLRRVDEQVSAKEMAWMYGRKVATVAQIVRTGRDASGLDLPDPQPYGQSFPIDFPESVRRRS